MKSRISLTLDSGVEETLRLQAKVLDIPLSRYINKILRDALGMQNAQIDAALERLERKRKIEQEANSLEGTSS